MKKYQELKKRQKNHCKLREKGLIKKKNKRKKNDGDLRLKLSLQCERIKTIKKTAEEK